MKILRTAPAFMLFAFCMGSSFLLATNYQRCMYVNQVSLYAIILYILWIHYSSIPYSKIYTKTRWMFPLIWVLSSILFNLCLKWEPQYSLPFLEQNWGITIPKSEPFRHGIIPGIAWLLYKPIFFGWMYWKTYVIERRYNLSSDPVNKKNVFVCLWRPQNSRSMIQSLVGLAVGSISIYAGGKLYGFKWGKPTYQVREVDPHVINRGFVAIDAGVPASFLIPQLKALVGSKAGIFRVRCVYVIRKILPLTPEWHELLPCRYGIKLLRWKDGQ